MLPYCLICLNGFAEIELMGHDVDTDLSICIQSVNLQSEILISSAKSYETTNSKLLFLPLYLQLLHVVGVGV